MEPQTDNQKQLHALETQSARAWQEKYYPNLTWCNYYRSNCTEVVPVPLLAGVMTALINGANILNGAPPTWPRLLGIVAGLAVAIGNVSRMLGNWSFYEKHIEQQRKHLLPPSDLWKLSPVQVEERFTQLADAYPELAADKQYFAEVLNMYPPSLDVKKIGQLDQEEQELLTRHRQQKTAQFEQAFADRYNNDLWKHSFVIAVSYLKNKLTVNPGTAQRLEDLVWRSKALQRRTAVGLLAATPEIIRRYKHRHDRAAKLAL